jgi:hypothetical protein
VTVKLSELFPEEGAHSPVHPLPAGGGRRLLQHTPSTASARQLLSAPTATAAARRKPLSTSSASFRGVDLEQWRDSASPKDRESLDTLTGTTGGRGIEPSPPVTLSSLGNPRGRRLFMGLGGVQPPSRRALLGSSAGSLETWIVGASAENQQAAKALGASSGTSKSEGVKITDLDLDR